ncbi:MAG: O-antigen ligase family protein [Atribacterota bacterium]|nr:O-antigen ligase family protein [Atribacterota bacterium]MDD4896686.1 O-antigen ligase family protein [Atribacterota bacterium]MDD5637967.1 O-antigen ligase family protein [Atribacterota bacterium]
MKRQNNLSLNKNSYTEWDEGIFIILIAIIVILPVIFYRYSIPNFAPIKELSLQICVVLSLTMWALKMITTESIYWQESSLDKPIFLYLLVGCLSLIWSINIYQSILAIPLFIAGPLLFYIITNSIQQQKKIEGLLLILIIVGLVMGIYGILQYFGIDFNFWKGNIERQKVMGLFGNVNYFAEYLILPIALTIGISLSKKKIFNRLFLFSALAVMGTTLFLTFTRGSYLAIAVTIPVIISFYYRSTSTEPDKQYYKKIVLLFLLLVIVALAIIYIPHPLNKDSTPLGKLRQRVTIENITFGGSTLRRVAIWKFTWMMIEDYPILGSGVGTYDYHTLKYQAEFFARGNNRDIYPHGKAAQAHNEYLQLWSELGIIGLLVFLWLIVSYYRNILKYLSKIKDEEKAITIGLTGGVTAVLVDALFGFPLQLAASISLFWLFIGLTICQINIALKSKKDTMPIEKDNHNNKKEILEDVQKKNSFYRQPIKKGIAYFIVVVLMIVCILFLIRPFIARIYYYHGNDLITKVNKNNEAIELYKKGLKMNPWLGELYYNIGLNLSARRLITPALEYYHKTEKFMDDHYLPRNIASLYLSRKEYDKAIPYLEKAIKYHQDKKSMVTYQLEVGNIYFTLKDYQNALRHFNDVIESNPNSVEGYYGRAGVYINQGKKDEAIDALKKVIEMAPESKLAGYAKTMLTKLEIEP